MSEHMIQTAMLAEKAQCSSNLICSSLLHDYGHFILKNPDSLVNNSKDGKHEEVGYKFLKRYFKKKAPLSINYRNYKEFDEIEFRNDLLGQLELFDVENMDYDVFKDIFMTVLGKYAPMKKKMVRGNNAPFMNKILSKAFMHRSKLKNNYNKNPTEENKTLYNRQRNFSVNLLRKEKKKYYNNLNMKMFQDNKKFWQTIKPLFSDKQHDLKRNIVIVEDNSVISDNKEVADKFNTFLSKQLKTWT